MSRFKKSLNDSYVGVSTEEKPTQGIEEYSLYKELDTNDTYYFYNNQWFKMQTKNSSGGGSSGGGALYVHLVFDESNQVVRGLQESYSDITTAVEEGKAVLGVWPFGDTLSAITTLLGFGVNNGKYFVQFLFMGNNTKDFVADTSTDPLVLSVDDSPSS